MVNKNLSFCIVCKDRIKHIQHTLLENINDNLRNDIEFILLDYNSKDGLKEWVYERCQDYIKKGVLSYYHNLEAAFFHRSHSRNMAIRLSNSKYVCNLDADNYLGHDFADYIIDLLERNPNTFITSDYSKRDTIGRVCISKSNFLKAHGYNELYAGYGFEDIDFYNRLQKLGLKQIYSSNNQYYTAIKHSNELRLEQEILYNTPFDIFIRYLTPYSVDFYVLYQDGQCIMGTLINNYNKIYNDIQYKKMDINKRAMSPYRRIILSSPLNNGNWYTTSQERICINFDDCKYNLSLFDKYILNDEEKFYKIIDHVLRSEFMLLLSEAINYQKSLTISKGNVNPSGFGQGIVYKNFDYSKSINLD